jgi:hypothetical protein
MNKMIFTAALTALAMNGAAAFAQRTVEVIQDPKAYDAIAPEQMDAAKLYFDDGPSDPVKFEDWKAGNPAQADILSLWKGYVEPTIPLRDGVRNTVKKLSVFLSRGKAVLNKPASAINFQSFITLDFISSLNSQLMHQTADPARLLPRISGRGPNPTFLWCNDESLKREQAAFAAGQGKEPETQPRFTRAAREGLLDFLNPPPEARGPWCDDPSKSVCIDSCFPFDYGWTQMVKLVNAGLPDDQKDLGQATQSELRYYLSEQEFGQPVAALTGVNTKVVGIVRQNLFYSNQILQSGTVTAIFQEFPGDPNRLVVSSYFMFTMGTDTVTASGPKAVIREVLMGRADQFNSKDGNVTAGLPNFTKGTAASLISILDK